MDQKTASAGTLSPERYREALRRCCVDAGLPESYADRIIAEHARRMGHGRGGVSGESSAPKHLAAWEALRKLPDGIEGDPLLDEGSRKAVADLLRYHLAAVERSRADVGLDDQIKGAVEKVCAGLPEYIGACPVRGPEPVAMVPKPDIAPAMLAAVLPLLQAERARGERVLEGLRESRRTAHADIARARESAKDGCALCAELTLHLARCHAVLTEYPGGAEAERQEPPLLAAGVVTKRIDRGDGASETSYYAIGPKRAHYHEALADFRALAAPGAGEQGQEPTPELRAAVVPVVRSAVVSLIDSKRLDPPATTDEIASMVAERVVETLAGSRWQAAAEELRLRKALERAELSVGTEAVTESEYQGFVRCRECGHSLRKIDGGCLSHATDCTFAALAQPASADAEALDDLVGTPERWIKEAASWAEHFDHEPLNEEASERARCAGELRALLRRLGLEPAA